MNKHTDLKIAAYVFQALGIIALLIALWYTALTQSMFFLIYGAIGFVWMYAIGGALLVLIDIAKSVRASAVVAIEEEAQRKIKQSKLQHGARCTCNLAPVKARPGVNDKPLGLQRVNPKKRKHA